MEDVKTILIDQEKCIGCSKCVTNCPANMLEMKDGKATVNYRVTDCKCFRCMSGCPVGAISQIMLSEVPAELKA